jgi:cysteine protease ATG4
MPIAAIDPSLAIGFYCGGPTDLEDLCGRLTALAKDAHNAPLMTVDRGGSGAGGSGAAAAPPVDRRAVAGGAPGGDGGGGADDWEML